jgi:opacity protein-like surface antigen
MKRMTTMRCLRASLSVSALAMALTMLVPTRADASAIDLGVAAGVVKRSLAETDYKAGFTWQLNADFTFFPLLKVGPYIAFAQSSPDIAGSPSSISFRTIGARAKLTLPLPGNVNPYGVVGAGWAHGDFPDQVLSVCVQGRCVERRVPSATANFAEFLVGGGVMWEAAKPLAFTAEFNWRPTTGYTNDLYEQQIQSGDTSTPEPSRNGVAWVGLLGVALAF